MYFYQRTLIVLTFTNLVPVVVKPLALKILSQLWVFLPDVAVVQCLQSFLILELRS